MLFDKFWSALRNVFFVLICAKNFGVYCCKLGKKKI